MIIDQLPLLSGDVESTDEIPIERGTTTYKTTQAALVKSAADAAAAAQTTADAAQTAADAAQTAADAAQDTADSKAAINDAATVSTATWSSTKIRNEIDSATPTVSGFVSYEEQQTLTNAQKAQARDNISAGVEWVLLWTNSAPTSAFASQKVTLDLTDYTEVKIVFVMWTGDSQYLVSWESEKGTNQVYFCFYAGKYYQRHLGSGNVIDDTGIPFANAEGFNSYGGGVSTQNNYMVPYKIYAK